MEIIFLGFLQTVLQMLNDKTVDTNRKKVTGAIEVPQCARYYYAENFPTHQVDEAEIWFIRRKRTEQRTAALT